MQDLIFTIKDCGTTAQGLNTCRDRLAVHVKPKSEHSQHLYIAAPHTASSKAGCNLGMRLGNEAGE